MILFRLKKQLWPIIILGLSAILLFLAFNQNFRADIAGIRKIHKNIADLFVYLFNLLPAILLFASGYWREQTLHKKILLFGLLSFLISTNFRVSQSFQFLFVFAITTIYYYAKEKRIYRPNLVLILLIVYFLLELISLAWSFNFMKGFEYLGRLSPIIIIPLLFCLFRLNENDFNLVAKYFFRFSIFYTVISIGVWILECHYVGFPLQNCIVFKKYSINAYTPFELIYAWSNHFHPTYNALNILFSSSLGWHYISKKGFKRNIAVIELFFLVISSLLLAIITASRFMLVGWIVVNVAGFLYTIRNKKKILYPVVAALLIAFLCIQVFTTKTSSFIKDPVRECLYNAAFQSIKENPVWGTGLGGMTKYINRNNSAFRPLNLKTTDEFPHIHPHNQFVGDLMQTGILGLIVILSIILSSFYLGYKNRNWLILINTLVFVFLMNIEMPLIYPPGIFIFTSVLVLLTNGLNSSTRTKRVHET